MGMILVPQDRISDRKLLTSLLNCGALSEEEESAFRGMVDYLESAPTRGAPRTLSDRQRKWAEAVYSRLNLDKEEPCRNLYSRGVGHPDKPLPKFGYEMLPRPLKPPGR